jgi:inward rectifier potassium channel
MARRKRPVAVKPYLGQGSLLWLRAAGHHSRDVYYRLLTIPQIVLIGLLTGAFLVLNVAFALAYLACGNGIENARPGSFTDAFFFSVQTMATIGYGKLIPVGLAANLLVTAEAALGLFGMAMAAALMFARYTRPTAGVMFSRNMVVTRFEGQPTLMFRLANERNEEINEARIHVVLLRDETTQEGDQFRMLHDMALRRSFTPTFGLSWSVMHVIDETSPLFGRSADDLAAQRAQILVLFSGHHEAFQQEVHSRHAYHAADIAWNKRFADLLVTLPDGREVVDETRLDELIPEPGEDHLQTSNHSLPP